MCCKAPELARVAAARLPPGLQVRDWTQENEAYFRAIRIEKTMMGLILMLIVAVAVFNIVATLVMVVNDKRTDIAILRTLGIESARRARGLHDARRADRLDRHRARRRRSGSRSRCNVDVIVPFLEAHLRLSHHGSRMSTTYRACRARCIRRDVVRIAVAALLLTFVATIYPALAGRANSARRSAAIRMMRYWYEGFLGLRYLRASPQARLRLLDRRHRDRRAGARASPC